MIRPGWVIVAGVLFGLVHLLAYRYLRRDGGPGLFVEGGQEGGVATPDPGRTSRAEREDAEVHPEEAAWCPTCGALNDAAYTFCRECTTRLEGATPG